MSTETISYKKEKEQTTEQHDCHIQTGNMSGGNTSNRKRKQETPEQCDRWLKKAREKAQLKREEETPQQHDRQLEKA